MRRLPFCLLLAISISQAAETPDQILQQAVQKVNAQLARAANYTCVETLDRTYFVEKRHEPIGCAFPEDKLDRQLMMHDRLRLDLAVSEGNEIYGWHAENKFSSSSIAKIVQTGPISSGNFIGFLHNIFLDPGIHFEYLSQARQEGKTVYTFKYVVPLQRSAYHVQSTRGAEVVAFHGSFGVNGADYQLTNLQVIADSLAKNSEVCSVETDVAYQMANISGKPSLIPATFDLKIANESHVYTVSHSEYSECHEFRGESTLVFSVSPAAAPQTAADPPVSNEWLPAGLILHIRLNTPVDDRTSYTGDAVSGVLIDSVHVPGTNRVIPKGALLDGVIIQLEQHYDLWKHYLLGIQFEHLRYGSNSFVLRALPQTPKQSMRTLVDVYGWPLPERIAALSQRGVFAGASQHVHLDSHFSGMWRTFEPPEKAPGPQAGN